MLRNYFSVLIVTVVYVFGAAKNGHAHASQLSLFHSKSQTSKTSKPNPLLDELIDIGIVAACVPKKLKLFKDRIDFASKWRWVDRVRFLMIRYECPGHVASDEVGAGILQGYPLVVATSSVLKFSRSSNINQMHKLVRHGARFLVVDVDMSLTASVLQNTLRYVKPGTVYFPIVWSKYSPRFVARVQREMTTNIFPYSGWEGAWRIHGFGMFALHQQDLARFPMNESFAGWGGEDNEFYERVKGGFNMSIVREKEPGLVHVWHDKNCSEIIQNPQKRFSCLGSRATYLGPPLALMLLMDEAIEKANSVFLPAQQYAPRILIVVPTSLALLPVRLPGIMTTWGKGLPANVALKFFVSYSVGEQAQQLAAALGFEVSFVAIDAEDSEYPPVRRNIAMLSEAVTLMEHFTWCLKVDDDTFVDVTRLQQLAYDLRALEAGPHLLGGRGHGREQDQMFLSLPPTGFCMGGPGYLMTRRALLSVAPHFHSCADYFDKHTYRDYVWHSDTVISKCFHHWAGLECWDKEVDAVYPFRTGIFQQHYASSAVNFDSVTFHPLKSAGEMVAFSAEKLRRDAALEGV